MRKPKTSKFGIGLLIYAVSLSLLVAIAVGGLCAFLSSFEQNRPDRIAQEYVEGLDSDSVIALMEKWATGELETAETLYGASAFANGEELKFRKKADEYTAQKPVYYVTAGTVRLGKFSLSPNGKASFGITKWKADELELFRDQILPEPQTYTVTAPAGATLTVNGTALDEKYLTESGAQYSGSVYFSATDKENYKCDTYTLPSLIFAPKITVNSAGIDLSPTLSAGKFDAFECDELSVKITAPSNAAVMLSGIRIPEDFFTKTSEPMVLTEFEEGSDIKLPTLMYARALAIGGAGEITATVDGKFLDVGETDGGLLATYRADSLRSLEISIPDGAQITLNGVAVSDKYFAGEGTFSMLEGMEKQVGSGAPAAKLYRIGGLFEQPQVSVTMNGTELPLCRSDEKSGVSTLEYYGAPDQSLKDSAQARAVDFANAYITYTCMGYNGVDEHHAAVMSFVLSGTDTYQKLKKSKESFSWAENYTVTSRTVEAGDFVPMGDNAFFCTVSYTASLKKYSYTIEQKGVFRILMVKNGGQWMVGGLLTETN